MNFAAEPVSVENPVLSGDPLDVCLDFGLFGIRTGPPSVRCERVGIQVRRHVAGRAGIGVHPPGAADVVSPLEDQIVGVPVLLKGDRGAEPGEPGPDDQYADWWGRCRQGSLPRQRGVPVTGVRCESWCYLATTAAVRAESQRATGGATRVSA